MGTDGDRRHPHRRGPGRARTARHRRAAGSFSGLPIAQAALRFARARHAGQHREIDHAPFIAHPIEVGRLLRGDGQPDEIIAAGLLHDVLEKTPTTSAELQRRFGSRIARSSNRSQTTHRSAITSPARRDLRDRVAQADPGTRAVFAADKIAKARELALLPSVAAERAREPRQARPLPRQPRDASQSRPRHAPHPSARRRAQPTPGARGRRNSLRRTDHERHRLEPQ